MREFHSYGQCAGAPLRRNRRYAEGERRPDLPPPTGASPAALSRRAPLRTPLTHTQRPVHGKCHTEAAARLGTRLGGDGSGMMRYVLGRDAEGDDVRVTAAIAAAQCGDEASFRTVYRSVHPRLLA